MSNLLESRMRRAALSQLKIMQSYKQGFQGGQALKKRRGKTPPSFFFWKTTSKEVANDLQNHQFRIRERVSAFSWKGKSNQESRSCLIYHHAPQSHIYYIWEEILTSPFLTTILHSKYVIPSQGEVRSHRFRIPSLFEKKRWKDWIYAHRTICHPWHQR